MSEKGSGTDSDYRPKVTRAVIQRRLNNEDARAYTLEHIASEWDSFMANLIDYLSKTKDKKVKKSPR